MHGSNPLPRFRPQEPRVYPRLLSKKEKENKTKQNKTQANERSHLISKMCDFRIFHRSWFKKFLCGQEQVIDFSKEAYNHCEWQKWYPIVKWKTWTSIKGCWYNISKLKHKFDSKWSGWLGFGNLGPKQFP